MALLGNVGTWWAPNLVVAQTPWRHESILGGGLAIDLGVHQFHMVRYVCGEIQEVQATASVIEPRRHILDTRGNIIRTIDCDADDTFFASFKAAGGVTGTLFASFAGHGKNTVLGNGPVFYGSKGRVTGDQIHLDHQPAALSLSTLFSENATAERKAESFPHGLTDPFAITQHFWLQAIRDGRQPALDGREGLLDLACAYAILESNAAGRRVSIKEILSGELTIYQAPINRHFQLT
jgi:predicted dehydrogenase